MVGEKRKAKDCKEVIEELKGNSEGEESQEEEHEAQVETGGSVKKDG